MKHISDELVGTERVRVETKYGPVSGARASNGAVVFLEIPYAMPPRRFQDPEPLPDGFRYEDKEYVYEATYAVQPGNDGQMIGIPFQDKVGYGQPSENPLFVNVVLPPTVKLQDTATQQRFPVKVYIHGGFLQFGSPHGLTAQMQYIAAARNQIWVNIGYRLSAFGFLACDDPPIAGNFGFKDQWLGLQWVKENITSFGGDPENISLTGLSAGAHSVHQILHHASRLPQGEKAPFQSAHLQSNAILTAPKKPFELRVQFEALCNALSLDPQDPNILSTLRDPIKVPWKAIIEAIEEERLGSFGTFRGCLDGNWIATSPEPLAWQRSGGFADGLKQAGIRSIIVGDLKEEWFLYSIAHPIATPKDVRDNLIRYYPEPLVDQLLKHYPALSATSDAKECTRLFGQILSDGQVHLPVRLLSRDLAKTGLPVVRYEVRWASQIALRFGRGYVTHGTDQAIWHLRKTALTENEVNIVMAWLAAVDSAVQEAESAGHTARENIEALIFREDGSIGWDADSRWDELMKLAHLLPEEQAAL